MCKSAVTGVQCLHALFNKINSDIRKNNFKVIFNCTLSDSVKVVHFWVATHQLRDIIVDLSRSQCR